jgi:aquaporin Z
MRAAATVAAAAAKLTFSTFPWDAVRGARVKPADMITERSPLHWGEYVIEASALGAFMVSAGVCAVALYHPASPLASAITGEWLRRSVMGLLMGATAVAIIYSPWGQRSGAHMNPAVTLTFFRLGKVATPDCLGYVLSHFAGAVIGMAIVAAVLGRFLSHASIHYVVTSPGAAGETVAFFAEAGMAFALMLVILVVSNRPALSRFTGVSAGLLVWAYITFEAPLSGMSLNPARTFGAALLAGDFAGLWIYFTAPPLGMLLAAEVYTRSVGAHRVMCAKLHHPHGGPCIFGCERRMQANGSVQPLPSPLTP